LPRRKETTKKATKLTFSDTESNVSTSPVKKKQTSAFRSDKNAQLPTIPRKSSMKEASPGLGKVTQQSSTLSVGVGAPPQTDLAKG